MHLLFLLVFIYDLFRRTSLSASDLPYPRPVLVQIQKAVKKAARREQLKREEAEQRRLKAVLEVQYVLDQLGEENVRQELRQVERGDDGPLLTEAELTGLDDFYKLVGPERDPNIRSVRRWEVQRNFSEQEISSKNVFDTFLLLYWISLSFYDLNTSTVSSGLHPALFVAVNAFS